MRETMEILQSNNMLKYFFIIIAMILIYSCKAKSISEDINNKNYLQNNEIELLVTDYKIIEYSEYEFTIIVNGKQIELEIEVTNSDKIMQLNKTVDPIIYFDFNNTRCSAKGRSGYKAESYKSESNDNLKYEYSFPIDTDGKIMYFEDGRIHFLGLFYE
jgi:uncharacterized protein (DUF427 family)